MIAYRVVLMGGKFDGQTMVADNPWYCCEWNGTRYKAEVDCEGQPVMEDGGEGNVLAVLASGDSFSPPMKTIRMYPA